MLTLCLTIARQLPIAGAREEQPQVTAFATTVDKPLTVMTYNIHSGRGIDGILDLDRIHEVIETSGAQIVALQEVDRWVSRTGWVDQMSNLARRKPWHHAYGANLLLPPGFYGNALLSAYPIRDSSNVSLASPRETRGFLRSVVEVAPGQNIAVYVTHWGLNPAEREEHAKILVRHLGREELPVVLMGDFNAFADSVEMRALQEVLHDVGAKEALPTFPADSPSHRIDYIFVSDHFEVKEVRVVDTLASDHLPVVAKLRLVR